MCRLLQLELGQRPDFVRMLAANFSVVPFYLEYEFGGSALSSWAVEDDALAALAVPERLALFLQIARAVSAVHGVGGDSQRPETRQRAHLR